MNQSNPFIHLARPARAVAGLCALLSACSGGGDKGPTTPALVLTTVVVSLAPATITVGQTASASASGLDQNGAAIAIGAVNWSTGSPAVATVTATGTVTGATPGQTQVVASTGGKQGQQSITVIPIPVATVTVAPATAALPIGGAQQLTAVTLDASGGVLTGRAVTWASSDSTRVKVNAGGLATAISPGSATVSATSEGKTGTAVITVSPPPVATVTVAPASAPLGVGAMLTLTATALDANGNTLAGRVFTWTTSNQSIVSLTMSGNTATLTGAAAGTATITATSEGKSGTSLITVTGGAQNCSAAAALQLAVGEIRTLTAAQVGSLCLGGASSASEYVMIPFFHTTTASATVQIDLVGTNTSAILTPPLASQGTPLASQPDLERARLSASAEWALRERERREMLPLVERARSARTAAVAGGPGGPQRLTSSPTVGQVVSLNSNGAEGCTNPTFVNARIVSVSQRSIVLVESAAPAGGFTDAELAAFGTAFDSQVYPLDVANFGAPTDIDNNGRIGIFFTLGVNALTPPSSQGTVLGFFYSRDLFPLTQCAGSNAGEMFYMPVVDPNSTNGFYKDKARLTNTVIGTLAHEFQHLINASRRLYVNVGANPQEEVWLNEGLSHIAEELLYYQQAGRSARTNINLSAIQSSQAQLDAFNTYAGGNFGRLLSYVAATAANSPYSQNDRLETRGAIWQLLRYCADRLAGTESSIWTALVNSAAAGQANFNNVCGEITGMTHDWAIAQFTDDAGLGVPAIYTNPSWSFRSILPAYFNPRRFPLVTISLPGGTPQTTQLSGGGAAYVRFRVAGGVLATVVSTSGGQPVPGTVDFILVRTQ